MLKSHRRIFKLKFINFMHCLCQFLDMNKSQQYQGDHFYRQLLISFAGRNRRSGTEIPAATTKLILEN